MGFSIFTRVSQTAYDIWNSNTHSPSTITSASSKAVQVWTSVIEPRRLYLRKAFLVERPSAGIAFYEDGKRLISVDLTPLISVTCGNHHNKTLLWINLTSVSITYLIEILQPGISHLISLCSLLWKLALGGNITSEVKAECQNWLVSRSTKIH